jgi:hypothetical protein
MVCRSKDRGEAAQKEIIDESKNQVIELLANLIELFSIFFVKLLALECSSAYCGYESAKTSTQICSRIP